MSPPFNATKHNPGITIYAIPAFSDNYLWLLHHTSCCVVIDPGDANAVIAALQQLELQLSAILITHKHSDHTGGVRKLVNHFSVPVYAPSGAISHYDYQVKDSDTFTLGDLSIQVIATPGHTMEHVVYSLPDIDQPIAFVGDTLFAAGCGRLFEGTPAQMWKSLQKIINLPDNTHIYCAHEYTRSNLEFARHIEPDNKDIESRYNRAMKHNNITLPTTVELEKKSNPFCRITSIRQANPQWQQLDDATIFGKIRSMKDNF